MSAVQVVGIDDHVTDAGYRNNSLTGNRNKTDKASRIAMIKTMAKEGYLSDQISGKVGVTAPHVRKLARENNIILADTQIGKVRKIDAHRVIEQTVVGLSGYAIGLQTINGAWNGIDADEALEWAFSLAESLKTINRLQTKLSDIATDTGSAKTSETGKRNDLGEHEIIYSCDACGVPVVYRYACNRNGNMRHDFCSYRCHNDYYMERRRQRLKLARNKVCQGCEKDFQAARIDSKYCSHACKQKAYRQRGRL